MTYAVFDNGSKCGKCIAIQLIQAISKGEEEQHNAVKSACNIGCDIFTL